MLFKKAKLEKALMEEIKVLAGVSEFPLEDAKVIAQLVGRYNNSSAIVLLAMMSAMSVLEKYPNLYENWDNLMKKYKKLGLFPKCDVVLYDH